MDDLISRQAAIDALYHVDEYNGRSVEAIRNLPSAQPYTEAEIQKMQDLEQAEIQKAYELGKFDAESRWIPCSESLPKEDGQYLITEKGTFGDYLYIGIANYGVPCMPMNKGKGRGWFITDSEGDYYCDMNHVLAWMPLPEPYAERRTDE